MSTKRTSEQVASPLGSLSSPGSPKRWRRLTVVVRQSSGNMDCSSRNLVDAADAPVAYSPKYGPDSPMYDGPVDPPSPKNGPDSPVYQEPEARSPRSPKSPAFDPQSPSYQPKSPDPACWDEEDEEEDEEDDQEDDQAAQPTSPTYRPQSPVV